MFFQIRHLFPVFERIDFTYWVKQDVGVFSNLLSRRIKKNSKSFQSLSVCFLYYSRPWVFPVNWGVFGGLREAVVRPRLCGWRGGHPRLCVASGGKHPRLCVGSGGKHPRLCVGGGRNTLVCVWVAGGNTLVCVWVAGETPSCVCGWRGKHPRLLETTRL